MGIEEGSSKQHAQAAKEKKKKAEKEKTNPSTQPNAFPEEV
jgi:hypothetical protein